MYKYLGLYVYFFLSYNMLLIVVNIICIIMFVNSCLCLLLSDGNVDFCVFVFEK